VTAPWLTGLEESLAADAGEDSLATALVVIAAMAGQDVYVGEDERHGATMRALLLLTAGGDPSRGLDLNGRAVTGLADELRNADRQLVLEAGIKDLRLQTADLPHVNEAIRALAETPDIAWRAYACSLLAEELGGDEV